MTSTHCSENNAITFESERASKDMYEYRLSNGMKVILVPRPGLEVVTANITYHVGSRNEGLGLSGATHYLEHGMFKGSKKFQGSNGMWKLEEKGMYMNATTYTDRTNYFEVMKASDLEDAIAREADRMAEPLLTEDLLKSEMSVVRNEYERGENNDFEILNKRIRATAFLAHPYHHSTIGWKSDIENVSAKALRKFHDTFYIPNNATYTFVGNFDPLKIKNLVCKYFAEIPSGTKPPKMYTEEPLQTGQRRVLVRKPSNTSLMGIAFKSVNGLHKDAITLRVLCSLMNSGPTAPFVPLKKQGVIHDVMPVWERMKDPYLFTLWVTTNYPNEVAMAEAEKAVMNLLEEYPRPSDSELDLVKKSLANEWSEKMESTRGMAMEINESISRGDAFDVHNRFDILKSITADDIVAVARKTFKVNQSTVGWFIPATKEDTVSPIKPEKYTVGVYPTAPAIESIPVPSSTRMNFKDATTSSLTSTFMKYNTYKTHLRVSLQTNSSSFNAFETVSRRLLSELMMKGVCLTNSKSTVNFDEKNIHNFLSANGIEREIVPSQNGVHLICTTTSKEINIIKQMVKLMDSELKTPSLHPDTFKYLKNKMLSELAGSAGNVDHTAKVLMSQTLFKDGGSNYQHSTAVLKKALYDLTHQDILDQHKALVKSGVTKISVLTSDDGIMDVCKKLQSSAYEEMKYNVLLNDPCNGAQVEHFIPGKTSCTVKWAHVVQNATELVPLKIAIGSLGNGFAGRLMKIVRDKEGLTYGIYANLKTVLGTHIFEVTATFNPTNLQKGIDTTEKVMNEWKNGVTREEVEIQKTMMLGSQIVHFDNPVAIANTIHNALLNDKPVGAIDSFQKVVSAVQFKDVNDALKKYIHVDRLKRVVVGTIPK